VPAGALPEDQTGIFKNLDVMDQRYSIYPDILEEGRVSWPTMPLSRHRIRFRLYRRILDDIYRGFKEPDTPIRRLIQEASGCHCSSPGLFTRAPTVS
jgi:hypothetical protein